MTYHLAIDGKDLLVGSPISDSADLTIRVPLRELEQYLFQRPPSVWVLHDMTVEVIDADLDLRLAAVPLDDLIWDIIKLDTDPELLSRLRSVLTDSIKRLDAWALRQNVTLEVS